jgi:FkbM family methyltransferase
MKHQAKMLRKIAEATRPFVRSIAASLRYAPRMWRWELVSRLASDLGVNAMAVQTGDGLLLSKVDDRVVLPWLARDRNFAGEIHDLMCQARDILRDGGTYLDIGANLGATTLPLAAVGGCVIHAFEPDPTNFQMLKANLAINCASHSVLLHQIALGDVNGKLAFEINPSNPGDNRLAGSGHPAMGESTWKRIEVEVRRLDDLFGFLAKPLVVKIDAQGAEAKIIAGGRRTLADAELISLEWYPYLLARVGGDPQPAIILVKGFHRARMMIGENNVQLEWQSGKEVAARMFSALNEGSDPYLYYNLQLRRT